MASRQRPSTNGQPKPKKDLKELEALLAPAIALIKAAQQQSKNGRGQKAGQSKATNKAAAAAAPGQSSGFDADTNRTVKMTIRLTEEERAQIQGWCGRGDASGYVRANLFNYPCPKPRPPLPEVNRLVYLELGRIGNNLNQIARAANLSLLMGNEVPFVQAAASQQLVEQIQDLKSMVQELRAAMFAEIDDDEGAEL